MKKSLFFLFVLLLLAAGGGVLFYGKLRASLPALEGEIPLAGLRSPVTITQDAYGIPTISAQSRPDAVRALGYVTARDRLFQMDLIRRKVSGRLSEIIGKFGLKQDLSQRVIGFNRLPSLIFNQLPEDQKEILQAYAEGVNALIRQTKTPPVEFVLLGYRPEPWKMEDSILVILSMFQDLYDSGEEERMMTVMEKTLPPEVVSFLTPGTDQYDTPLLGGAGSNRPIQPIPVEALASVLRTSQIHSHPPLSKGGRGDFEAWGSNSWAVSQSKTADGRAILADDMHLSLSFPNIWYRASLEYGDVKMTGVLLPGVPVVIAGSNGHLAWGFTSINGDFFDLVRLEMKPDSPLEYKTPEGWKKFEMIPEKIRIRWWPDVTKGVKATIWGPVSDKNLLEEPVAIHWTALDPQAIDIGLLHMDEAKTLAEGLRVMNLFGGPHLNAVLADSQGKIAWTLAGRVPIRKGFDGTSSKSWADGRIGWFGYVPPEQLPRVIDPPSGFVATANHRTLGKEFPYTIGYNFENGYRAHRISERLGEMKAIAEKDMLGLQLDTRSEFYDFYRKLALDLLSDDAIQKKPLLAEAKREIEGWNGKADLDSRGFGLLVGFRTILIEEVFAPFLESCRKEDKEFSYEWDPETPLRMMLESKPPEINPDSKNYSSWDEFLLAKLEKSAEELKSEYEVNSLNQLPWGEMNRSEIGHLLFRQIPLLRSLFGVSREPQPGCDYCVRVSEPDYGATERMVVSPGREKEGILHMPGGQSGHPLSPNYRDQHPSWAQGEPMPFLPGPAAHTLTLQPEK